MKLLNRLFGRSATLLPPEFLAAESDLPEPSLASPVSQACTFAQMEEPVYVDWCFEFGEEPRYHRKQWEFCYILQALQVHGMLAEGKRGLGFGVGAEPLTSLIAEFGASVLATDLEPKRARRAGWVATDQHVNNKQALNERGLCDQERFDELVDFRFMNMKTIDPDLAGEFDFCWSACAFEHLGTIAAGLDFVENSVECLKPGGVAVHTTEFNCSSNDETLDRSLTVLFRKRDFLALADRLRSKGCEIDFNFNLGEQPQDQHIDMPPYSGDNHLKLQLKRWVTTSFGLIIRKGAA